MKFYIFFFLLVQLFGEKHKFNMTAGGKKGNSHNLEEQKCWVQEELSLILFHSMYIFLGKQVLDFCAYYIIRSILDTLNYLTILVILVQF